MKKKKPTIRHIRDNIQSLSMGKKYSAIIRPISEAEGGGYLAEYPDLKGCFGVGETPEKALSAAQGAFKSWILTAREFGDDVPEPKADYSGLLSLRMPVSLHGALAHRAEYEKISLNSLISNILSQYIKPFAR